MDSNYNTDSGNLLPKRRMNSSEDTAEAILWTMNNLLPWHVPAPKAGTHVFRSRKDMAAVWASHGGTPDRMPKVDFAQEMVIAVFVDAGSYTTAPTIRSIRIDGATIRVTCGMSTRPWAMTNPASVIKLPQVDGDVVSEHNQ